MQHARTKSTSKTKRNQKDNPRDKVNPPQRWMSRILHHPYNWPPCPPALILGGMPSHRAVAAEIIFCYSSPLPPGAAKLTSMLYWGGRGAGGPKVVQDFAHPLSVFSWAGSVGTGLHTHIERANRNGENASRCEVVAMSARGKSTKTNFADQPPSPSCFRSPS